MSGHKEPLYNIAKCKIIAKAWHAQHYAAIESDATGRKAREGAHGGYFLRPRPRMQSRKIPVQYVLLPNTDDVIKSIIPERTRVGEEGS